MKLDMSTRLRYLKERIYAAAKMGHKHLNHISVSEIQSLFDYKEEVQALPDKWRKAEKKYYFPSAGFKYDGNSCANEVDAIMENNNV